MIIKNRNNQILLLWLVVSYSLLGVLGIFEKSILLNFILEVLFVVSFFFTVFGNITRNHNRSAYSPLLFIIIFSVFSFIVSSVGIFKIGQLTNEYLLVPYLIVIVGAFRIDKSFISSLPLFFSVSSLVFLIVVFLNRETIVFDSAANAVREGLNEANFNLDVLTKRFCRSSFLLLLFLPFIKIKKVIIPLVACVVFMSMALFLGRRNLIVSVGLLLGFLYLNTFHYLFSFKIKNTRFYLFLMVSIGLIALYYAVPFVVDIINGNSNSLFFSELSMRVDEDSRSDVHQWFYRGMNENPLYWIFGKGINGSYYCPGTEESAMRQIVETGWYQVIFKVGIVGTLIILNVFIRSIRKIKNANILIRACVFYIIISMLEMVYAGVPAFNSHWVVLWLCVALCNSPDIRNLSNEEVIELINK